jgi:hypothetical protein
MKTKEGIPYANYSIQPAPFLISHIYWLDKIRKSQKEEDVVSGINISISILLCSYVEAVLFQLLLSIIEKRKAEATDTFYLKLLDEAQSKLTKASWTQYLDICENILPMPLNRYTDNETWKGIAILFYLRNIIVHGKLINAKLLFKDDKYQLEYTATFEKVMNYFNERKVLKQNHLNSDTHKILSTQVTKHFLKLTDKFVDEIFWKISDEQKVDIMIFQNAYKMNILKSHGIDPDTLKKRKNKVKKSDLPF